MPKIKPKAETRTCQICKQTYPLPSPHFAKTGSKGDAVYYRKICRDCFNRQHRKVIEVVADVSKIRNDDALDAIIRQYRELQPNLLFAKNPSVKVED